MASRQLLDGLVLDPLHERARAPLSGNLDIPELEPESDQPVRVHIRAIARITGKTGVEMEALTAVSVAALTIYDMCKAIDKTMVIDGVRLVKKTGGTKGTLTV